MEVKISVVIITFNEEKNIERCLNSIKAVADEIVVVDSFSTDRTKEICQGYGVRFLEHKFDGHIEQKNWAMQQASNKHILSLDADEALSEKLKSDLLKVKQDWKFGGYSFNRLTNYCGTWIRHGGWYPDRKLRLWDSSLGEWGGVNPHDKVVLVNKSAVKHIDADLLHYSFYSVEEHLRQIDYFTDISSKQAVVNGVKSTAITILAAPIFKFLRDYFFKLGFLDGYHGYVVAKNSAYAKWLKYSKTRNLRRAQNKSSEL